VLEAAHLTVEILDLLEELLGGVGRPGWQELETLPQEGPAPDAEEIADLEMVEGVLGQVAWIRFLSCVRWRTRTMRVRGRSR
jgi:hypothetical protein